MQIAEFFTFNEIHFKLDGGSPEEETIVTRGKPTEGKRGNGVADGNGETATVAGLVSGNAHVKRVQVYDGDVPGYSLGPKGGTSRRGSSGGKHRKIVTKPGVAISRSASMRTVEIPVSDDPRDLMGGDDES